MLIAKPQHRQRKRIRLPLPDYHRQDAWYFLTICCRNRKSYFREEEVRFAVVDLLQQTARQHHVEVAAYSVMPDHLHLTCSAGTEGVIRFIRCFKGRVAAEIRQRFGMVSPWQQSFFDHKLRSEESLRQKCEYVWMNPVRRGLVRNPEDYLWSASSLSA